MPAQLTGLKDEEWQSPNNALILLTFNALKIAKRTQNDTIDWSLDQKFIVLTC